MRDARVVSLAGRQFNRIARRQLEQLGISQSAIEHALSTGRLAAVEEGVYAFPPVLEDAWGRWMGATLTAPATFLALWSAAVAYGALERGPALTSVMRAGSGGPRTFGGIREYRRRLAQDEVGTLRGVPITTPERTLLDLAPYVPFHELARALRNMVRLGHTTLAALTDHVGERPRRRGARKLMRAVASHAGLRIDRARSGTEVRAMQVIAGAPGKELPLLNRVVAGFEADLVWLEERVIVEIDGGPFHQDRGEDARKEAAWRAAGFQVRRIDSERVWRAPAELLARAVDVKK